MSLEQQFQQVSQASSNQEPKAYRLESIDIYNFKSFGGLNYVGPFKEFTCIIGPNGGGKSNIIDAICFVLNYKTQMQVQLKEIIYKQQSSKKDELNSSVTITFTLSNKEQISLKKILDYKLVQEYQINNQRVSLKEYNDCVKRIGLSSPKNFLIMQHETDFLVSRAPQELTQIFEEASGSIECKEAYDNSKTELNNIENQLKEQSIELAQLKTEKRKILQKQKNSENFIKLQNEVDSIEQKLYLIKFLELDLEIDKSVKEHIQTREKIQKLKKDKDDITKHTQKLASTVRDTKSKQKVVQDEYQKANQQLQKVQCQVEELQVKENLINSGIDKKQNQLNKINLELIKIEKEENSLKAEEIQIEVKLKQINEEIQKSENDGVKGPYYDEYKQIQLELAKQMANYNSQKEKIQISQQKLNLDKISTQNQYEQILEKEKDIESNLDNIKSTKLNYQKQVNELQQQIQQLENSLKNVEQLINQNQSKKQELSLLKSKVEQASLGVELAMSNHIELKSERDLQIELKRFVSGFQGELAALCRPIQPRFEVAVKMAFGKALSYYIVQKSEDAVACSSVLKDKGLFKDILVLENLPQMQITQIQSIRERLLNEGNLLQDVVEYERKIPNLEKAISYLLRGKILCETMSKANSLRKKKIQGVSSIVTYDGQIIKEGAIVTCGDVESYTSSINRSFGSGQVEQAEQYYKNVYQDYDKLYRILKQDDLDSLDKSKTNILDNIIKLNQELKLKEEEIKNLNNRQNDSSLQLKSHKEENSKLKTQLGSVDKVLKQVTDEEIELLSKIKELETKVFQEFCRKVGVSDISQFRGDTLMLLEKNIRLRDDYKEKLILIRGKLKSEMSAKIKDNIHKIQEQISSDQQQSQIVKKQIDSFKKQQSNLEQQYKHSKEQLDNMQMQLTEQEQNLKLLYDENHLKNQNLLITERELKMKEFTINQLLGQKMQLYEELKIQNVDVPVSQVPSQFEVALMSQYELGLIQRTEASSQVSIDYRELDIDLQPEMEVETSVVSKDVIDEKKKLYDEQLKSKKLLYDEYSLQNFHDTQISRSTRRLEDIDDEIDQFSDVIKRLTETRNKQMEEFNQIKNNRKNIFLQYFDQVSQMIDRVYKELSRETEYAEIGGSSSLILENMIEPYLGGILYQATPPSKRYVFDIDRLSGGEKTIAGLALMITLNRVSNIPILIMDETDSFLDSNNVLKMLKYLLKLIRKDYVQAVLITHKNGIFRNSDTLVGTTYSPPKLGSQCFSIDLRSFSK